MELKVEIVTTDFITPSSPSPSQPKIYQLSLMDQLNLPEYIPLVLYYPVAAVPVSRSSISQHLKKSLSTTLNLFYPFVGRTNAIYGFIDCSTIGVPYKEANVDAYLADVVAKRDPNVVWPLLPSKAVFDKDAGTIPLLIQASFFLCGGMTIGICASHLVVDGVSFAEFLHSWASVSSEHVVQLLTAPPDLVIVKSLLPPSNLVRPQKQNATSDDNVTKSLVFSGASISALKLHISGANYQLTRVQSVMALVWKCMMKAVSTNSRTNGNSNSSSILTIFVNMRTRVDPPLPQNCFGNFYGSFNIQKNYNGDDISSMNLVNLTDLQKFGLKDFCKRLDVDKEALSSIVLELFEEKINAFAREDVDLFSVSSWCGVKFYEIDFGWGKPTWVSTNYVVYNNYFTLIDTKESDGVEAWVSLRKHDMAVFEQDKELLSFASFTATPNLSNGK